MFTLRVRRLKKLLYKNTCKKQKWHFCQVIDTSGYIVWKFIHHTHIRLYPNTQFFTAQQHAYQSFLGYFLVCFRLHPGGMPGKF